MTCHMMWGYRPKLWEKGLEEWYQGIYIWHSVLMENIVKAKSGEL